MTASLLRRWLNADLIVLAAVHGKHAKTVLSRPARKTVAHASRLQVAGILIPRGLSLQALKKMET